MAVCVYICVYVCLQLFVFGVGALDMSTIIVIERVLDFLTDQLVSVLDSLPACLLCFLPFSL